MHTERDGEKENRHSFEEAKNKRVFEDEIDKAREKVAEKKEKKAEKRIERDHE